MAEIKDFPKLHSPFVREFNEKKEYVVTTKIAEDLQWVFEDPEVLALEKLDGSNCSIIIKDGKINRIFNRKNEIPFFSSNKGHRAIIDGILNAYERGYCNLTDGQYFGELIGKKFNGDYSKGLKDINHLWIPFNTYGRKHLSYKSWGKYPKTYEALRTWFKDDIFSLFMRRRGIVTKPEGVVFVQPSTGKMAKLRLDMFDFYEGKRHEK